MVGLSSRSCIPALVYCSAVWYTPLHCAIMNITGFYAYILGFYQAFSYKDEENIYIYLFTSSFYTYQRVGCDLFHDKA